MSEMEESTVVEHYDVCCAVESIHYVNTICNSAVLQPHLFSTFYNSRLAGLRVAVWTTTPWTIPANLAVAVNR